MAVKPFLRPLGLSNNEDNFLDHKRGVEAWKSESLEVQQPYPGELEMPDELKELVRYIPRTLNQQKPIKFAGNFFFCGYSVENNRKIFFCGQCGFSREKRHVVEKHAFGPFHPVDQKIQSLNMGVVLHMYRMQKLRERAERAQRSRAAARQSILEERRRLEAEQSNAVNNPPPSSSPDA